MHSHLETDIRSIKLLPNSNNLWTWVSISYFINFIVFTSLPFIFNEKQARFSSITYIYRIKKLEILGHMNIRDKHCGYPNDWLKSDDSDDPSWIYWKGIHPNAILAEKTFNKFVTYIQVMVIECGKCHDVYICDGNWLTPWHIYTW